MVLVRVYPGFWLASVTYVHLFLSEDGYLNLHHIQFSQKMHGTMVLQNLLRREPLKLVDGGQSQRTFVYIKDAIEAVVLMIVCYCLYYLWLLVLICPNSLRLNSCFSVANYEKENPARANGHIFNVGNPDNEVTVRELAQMMTEVCHQIYDAVK